MSNIQAPHAYKLARDYWDGSVPYVGPSWVPLYLWMVYDCGRPSQREAAQVLIYGHAKAIKDTRHSESAMRDLWNHIAQAYPNKMESIASALPEKCAAIRDAWRSTPRVTIAAHRKTRNQLAKQARALSLAIDALTARPDFTHYKSFNFSHLMTAKQIAQARQDVYRHNHYIRSRATLGGPGENQTFDQYVDSGQASGDWQMTERLLHPAPDFEEITIFSGVVPGVADSLAALARFLDEDAKRPPAARPKHKNAERNDFVDGLIDYFERYCGLSVPVIIARIASAFFVQSIDANEVSQRKGAYLKSRARSETSRTESAQ